MKNIGKLFNNPAVWAFLICLLSAYYVGQNVTPTWVVKKVTLDVKTNSEGKLYYTYEGKPKLLPKLVSYEKAMLHPKNIEELNSKREQPSVSEEFVFTQSKSYYQLLAKKHWQYWSLLPAFLAILLCWMIHEPIMALASGIIAGAFILGEFDILGKVLIPSITNKSTVSVMILFWLLGGLMGIWSRNGASKAFAEFMTKNFVRGPRSAKLVAWFLGIVFFQGSTISTILVGTTVKPVADQENVSHEELSLVVDTTASPIAVLLAFNGWPAYVQAFLYVSGVAWLATEKDRLAFFFSSIPFSFYALFAVIATFLISIEKFPLMSKKLKEAQRRARETGQLDAPGADPLSAKELELCDIPEGYTPHIIEFVLPLVVLLSIAVGTYIFTGSPEMLWAFGSAVLLAILISVIRGMGLKDIVEGLVIGWKGVVLAAVILMLAIAIGDVSKNIGGGHYLVELLGDWLPYYVLPAVLLLLAIIIAFSTGTSWGTFAIVLPLAMPLAYHVAITNDLADPKFYMMICFIATLNGGVYGDQCSPISDTTILSSMSTGCDLMDHVKTQIPVATMAAVLAAICWTLCVLFSA